MFLINTETGKVKSYEEWCYDVYDHFITQDTFDNLIECNEVGDIL